MRNKGKEKPTEEEALGNPVNEEIRLQCMENLLAK
jgi:hypothetical protein